ncbi:MAG: glycosyl hydrolase family 28-related protein [Ferruginibacter sp.]
MSSNVNHGVYLFCLLSLFFMVPLFVNAQNNMEEFNGPYDSWANIKTRFGAKGDGIKDDTRSFQKALDSLSDYTKNYNTGPKGYATIYIPRGKYKLTATLVLKGKIGIKIVGEDPGNTMLLWNGNDSDTMFWANGSSYFSLSRLCWNTGGRKNMEAIGLHWKSVWNDADNRSFAPEQIEFSDHIFMEGFANGISGGTFPGDKGTGMNESEITIRRCVFNNCTGSGILISGFNALDYWIWDCKFIKCYVGVTSNSGNYHIYKSYFSSSRLSDVNNTNSYYTSVRFCYSENAAAFSLDNGSSSNPFKRIFEGNIVVGIINAGIYYGHTGKITLMDNNFSAEKGRTPKFLEYGSWSPSHFDVLDLNNIISGFSSNYVIAKPSRVFTVVQTAAQRSASVLTTRASFLKEMGTVPPYVKRVVFNIPANGSSKQIQEIINKAALLKKRAVVHFPYGIYWITKALSIPENADITLEGDGFLYASIIRKVPSAIYVNGAALNIKCPTTVVMHDLHFDLSGSENDEGRAIALVNADQPGSRVIIDQLYCDNDTSFLVKEYDYTLFQKANSFFTTGNYVSGGEKVRNGTGTARVQSFGAQFANLTLEQNGSFTSRDCWWEGPALVPIHLRGSGNFAVDGAMIGPRKLDSSIIISLGSFSGKVSFLDMYLIGSIDIKKDNPNLQLMAWNLNFYYKKRPLSFLTGGETYKGFFGGITTQCFSGTDPDCAALMTTSDVSVNIKNPDIFMDEMTKSLRAARPISYSVKPAGITNFYLSRVSISERYRTGIAFTK